MDVPGLQGIRRQALALDGGVGGQGRGGRAMVGHAVGDGEHELVVHLHLAGERQALRRGVGQGDGMALRQDRAGGSGPHGVGAGQALQIGAGPAEVGEIGVEGACGPEHLHRRGILRHRLAIALQVQVVDACAGDCDRAGEARAVDADSLRARRQRLGAGHGDHGRRVRQGAGGCAGLRRRGGLRRLLALPRGGLQHEHLVEDQQHPRADDEDQRVPIIVLHGPGAAVF